MTVLFDAGDAIKGDKVIAKARKSSKMKLINYTSSHKGIEYILTGSVFCVIDKAIKSVREKTE